MSYLDIEERQRNRYMYLELAEMLSRFLDIELRESQLLIWTMVAELYELIDEDSHLVSSYGSDMLPALMREVFDGDYREYLPLAPHRTAWIISITRKRKKSIEEKAVLQSSDYIKEKAFAKDFWMSNDLSDLGTIWKKTMALKDKDRLLGIVDAMRIFKKKMIPVSCEFFGWQLNEWNDSHLAARCVGIKKSKQNVEKRINKMCRLIEQWICFIEFDEDFARTLP